MTTGEGGLSPPTTPNFSKNSIAAHAWNHHGPPSLTRPRPLVLRAAGSRFQLSHYRPQCALGVSQLQRLEDFVARRHTDRRSCTTRHFRPVRAARARAALRSLFVVASLCPSLSFFGPDHVRPPSVFEALRGQGLGVNVHYIPVHSAAVLPATYGSIPETSLRPRLLPPRISLPLFPAMTDDDVQYVIERFWRNPGVEP